MTATLILALNIFVAALFAAAFKVVARNNPEARGAKWIAAAAVLAIVNIALEFVLPLQGDPAIVMSAIFLVFLLTLTTALVGISRHYGLATPRRSVAAIWCLALLIVPLNVALPYGSGLRTVLYQFPYIAMQTLIVVTIFRSGSSSALDRTLLAVAGLSVFVYAAKPLIAWHLGTAGMPQGYMTSQYAAISQSLGTVTLVAMALALLLIMMRDLMTEMEIRSETDPLSGLLNRRGFDIQGERMVAEARRWGQPVALITMDMDHFKSINDRYGHAIGDSVIARFAGVLGQTAPSGSIVARLGGEEFAVLLRGSTAEEVRVRADQMRSAIENEDFQLPARTMVTASFGIGCLTGDEDLFSLLRRSDAALYKAKADGRNVVRCADGDATMSAHGVFVSASWGREMQGNRSGPTGVETSSKRSAFGVHDRISLPS